MINWMTINGLQMRPKMMSLQYQIARWAEGHIWGLNLAVFRFSDNQQKRFHHTVASSLTSKLSSTHLIFLKHKWYFLSRQCNVRTSYVFHTIGPGQFQSLKFRHSFFRSEWMCSKYVRGLGSSIKWCRHNVVAGATTLYTYLCCWIFLILTEWI